MNEKYSRVRAIRSMAGSISKKSSVARVRVGGERPHAESDHRNLTAGGRLRSALTPGRTSCRVE